ncbi:MAG: alpha-2-macroglobulin, partial [Thiobacillus sp.]|nr:alpha-2-macroglobulin [Thiobacillus sp.]
MRRWIGIVGLCAAFAAHAAGIEAFSPQGTVKGVRQATARFDTAMVALGDPRTAAPFEIDCPVPGSGSWVDERTWAYDFERDLPGASRCTFTLRGGLKDLAGQPLKAETFRFDSGGPQAVATRPWDGSLIDERQTFLLVFDARVKPGTLAARASCQVRGLVDRIEAEVLQGTQRDAALAPLKAKNDPLFRRRFAPNADTVEVLRCKRVLPNDAEVGLLLEPGIEAGNGLSSAEPQRFDFRVRPAFRLRASCDKLNARAACNPLTDIRVNLGGAIRRDDALKMRLDGGGRSWAPTLDDAAPWIESLVFKGPFPEKAQLSLSVPAGLRDDDGRMLANASQFPLAILTDALPPLAKFSASFGVLEAADPVLPVTLRNLETAADDRTLALPGKMAAVRAGDDAMVIGWLKHLESVRYGRSVANVNPKKPPLRQAGNSFSVLEHVQPLAEFAVPKPNGGKAFEVVGIPLAGPGFFVVELASPRLGAAYLDGKTPFYTHTAALVTNLVAHAKIGRESSLVWVTALDSGLPVADAQVAVRGCDGKTAWEGATDAQGRARIAKPLGEAPRCKHWPGGWFVSARVGQDRSFTLTSWNDGIESWRFALPAADTWAPEIAHSVLDRSLVRAGDTLAMKLFFRARTGSGFAIPKTQPDQVVLTHAGSGQALSLPVKFDATGIAEAQWPIPREAKLGAYDIELARGKRRWPAGQFSVSAFRLPTMRAQIGLPKATLVRATRAEVDVGVQYLAGGGASGLPVKLRSLVEPLHYTHPAFPDTAFANGNVVEGIQRDEAVYENFAEFEDGADSLADTAQTGLARTQTATLDRAGAARLTVAGLPQQDTLATLRLELDYADANGVTQTVSQRATLWPGTRIPGIRIADWNARDALRYTLAVIDPDGKPVAGARVESDIYSVQTYSHRKRLVGGFYAYENVREIKRVAAGCAGETGASGVLACEMKPPARGSLIVRVKTRDAAGNVVYTHRDLWVPGRDDAWFAGSDSDRMDVLPERPKYEPGETAELQVKLPFRSATALVTVEREGVLDSFIVPLSAASATVRLPIKPSYAPNVAVSVLAVRGRVGTPAPTALVDLAKPAYKLGVASIRVGERGFALKVDVKTPQTVYKVRDTVPVSIQVARADGGRLPAGAEVAVAAVDEALLELAPNPSWKLLDTMLATRPWEVETATAQMQVVGKRHFGRKSLPPGGGGGKLPTRELFDTRVLWQARVKLDANGRAQVKVPLNDSLTRFRIVAVANAGANLFGDGAASVATRQEVMLLAGLPPVVREGDAFDAQFTVRNGSEKPQTVTLVPNLKAGDVRLDLAPKTVALEAGEARALAWPVRVPAGATTLA